MTTYLPDTNVFVDALNGKRGRREWLRELVLQGNRLACCAITLAEVYAGMWPHEQLKTDEFLSAFVWYGSSRAIARRAGRLRFDYARKGVTLSLLDTLIAATALEYGLTLITGNRKHFPMPELSIYPLPGGTA
ncbi:MAG: type II toxin-antitoxin system VapC family toxin [Acidobacteriaceae bacterium]|nr:type II toxin-antitoxin system VapC family toxin [Acidobacteriaceae bacterium]